MPPAPLLRPYQATAAIFAVGNASTEASRIAQRLLEFIPPDASIIPDKVWRGLHPSDLLPGNANVSLRRILYHPSRSCGYATDEQSQKDLSDSSMRGFLLYAAAQRIDVEKSPEDQDSSDVLDASSESDIFDTVPLSPHTSNAVLGPVERNDDTASFHSNCSTLCDFKTSWKTDPDFPDEFLDSALSLPLAPSETAKPGKPEPFIHKLYRLLDSTTAIQTFVDGVLEKISKVSLQKVNFKPCVRRPRPAFTRSEFDLDTELALVDVITFGDLIDRVGDSDLQVFLDQRIGDIRSAIRAFGSTNAIE